MRNRFFYLRLLRASLLLGGLYDLAFAGALLLSPEIVAQILRVPLPGPAFYLWLLAVVLAMVAVLLLVAADDPRRYSAVVVVTAIGRCAGAVALGIAAFQAAALGGLWSVAGVEASLGVAHGWLWGRIR